MQDQILDYMRDCARRYGVLPHTHLGCELTGAARSVWNTGGCGSWYFDRNDSNSIQWPGFTFEFRRRTRRFDPGDYRLSPHVPVREATPV